MKKGLRHVIIIFLVFILSFGGYLGFYFFRNNNKNKEKIIIKIDDVGFSNINLSWNNIKDANEYKVIICNELTDKEINNIYSEYNNIDKCIIKTTKESKINLESLKINKMYYIIVSVNKNNNSSLNSSIEKVKTENIKLASISNLKVSDILDESANLSWDEYKTELDNINISKISYIISIQDKSENIEVNENYAKIDNLTPLTKYIINVGAKIIIDDEEYISELVEETFITLGIKVSNLKTSSNTNSITLNWNKYDTSSEVLYDVYSSSSKNGEYTLVASDIKDEKYVASNLSEGIAKYFYVIAKIKIDEEYITSIKSDIVSGTTKKSITNNNGNNSSANNNNGELTNTQKDAAAREVARQIASRVSGNNDLEKIQSAAYEVALYANKATYTNDDKDYRLPYGVFIKGVYTCAGTARALGMVLEEMGYNWKHVNENQWSHQWVELTVNGQKMWADAFPTLLLYGKTGMAGFGDYPYA